MSHYRYGQVDWRNVDELAVQFACQGTRMELNRDELTVAAGRMAGRCPAREIARRCCADERQVVRILNALGASKCDQCKQLVFVEDGRVQRHVLYGWGDLCPMSDVAVGRQLEAVSA